MGEKMKLWIQMLHELNVEFQILKFLLVSHRVTVMVTFGFLPLNSGNVARSCE